jgi:hypothetical protein
MHLYPKVRESRGEESDELLPGHFTLGLRFFTDVTLFATEVAAKVDDYSTRLQKSKQ